jgi:hypothetical protein
MTRRYRLIVTGLLVASCDRSDYVIDLKRTHIERVDRDGGIGYVVVDKASADTMAKYGDVYVQGRTCSDVTCRTIPVGTLVKYDQMAVKGGVRLDIAILSETDAGKDHPPFWLGHVACFRLEAVQGFMGRTGRSDWNCSVTSGTE